MAAALLLASIGSWLVLSAGHVGFPEPAAARQRGAAEGTPAPLEALLRGAEPEDALAGLDFLDGLGGLPDAAAADDVAGERADPDFGGLFLLDAEELDAEARAALLEWLRERVGRGGGVES